MGKPAHVLIPEGCIQRSDHARSVSGQDMSEGTSNIIIAEDRMEG